jgi:two-component system response regulator HydG
LIVDDEQGVLRTLADALGGVGVELLATTDSTEALELVRMRAPTVMLTDLKMPGMDGQALLNRAREVNPDLQVVVITGHGSIEDAVAAMKAGAYDFITKPFSVLELRTTVQRALEKADLLAENARLRDKLKKSLLPAFAEGKNPAFRELLDTALKAADSEATVLILGESGTGKEVLANYVAAHSRRAAQPFIAVNCAAIPESLIESELFGHKKGAFTGAYQSAKGRFQEANGGTLFLDEIGELPLSAQSKLLRVLQEGEVVPVGGASQKVDVRVIAATNKPLREMTATGAFREDLFYRLNVVALNIPPLRHRMEDLATYVAFFIAKYCRKNRRDSLAVSPEALRLLERYSWPGNLRELENVLERAVVLTRESPITAEVLPPELKGEIKASVPKVAFARGMTLEDIEHKVIHEVLAHNRGDRSRSALELGIGVRTLYRKLNEIYAKDLAAHAAPTDPGEAP